MFHLINRRLVLHATRSRPHILLQARNASTPSKPKAARASISDAITNPAPPLRWVYRVVAFFIFGHIFWRYFYSYGTGYGQSMLPTINTTGDHFIFSRFYRRGRGIEIGDLVSFKHPLKEGVDSVKRVLGMPGDFVLRDTPGTSGMMMQVPEGHCWVVGDNLEHSRDSRIFGPLPLALIKGKVVCRFSWDMGIWPHSFDRGLNDPGTDEDDVD